MSTSWSPSLIAQPCSPSERERQGERERERVNEGVRERELQHGVNKLIIFVANKNPHARWISISLLLFSSNMWFVISMATKNPCAIGFSLSGVVIWGLRYLWPKILLLKWVFFVYNKLSCKMEFN